MPRLLDEAFRSVLQRSKITLFPKKGILQIYRYTSEVINKLTLKDTRTLVKNVYRMSICFTKLKENEKSEILQTTRAVGF